MLVGSLKDVHEFTGILVDVAVLIGAIVAAYEYFKLGRRWTSDLECSHYELPDCYVIFTAYYTLRNTGRRPLHVNKVTIRLTALKEEKTVREKTVLLWQMRTKNTQSVVSQLAMATLRTRDSITSDRASGRSSLSVSS